MEKMERRIRISPYGAGDLKLRASDDYVKQNWRGKGKPITTGIKVILTPESDDFSQLEFGLYIGDRNFGRAGVKAAVSFYIRPYKSTSFDIFYPAFSVAKDSELGCLLSEILGDKKKIKFADNDKKTETDSVNIWESKNGANINVLFPYTLSKSSTVSMALTDKDGDLVPKIADLKDVLVARKQAIEGIKDATVALNAIEHGLNEITIPQAENEIAKAFVAGVDPNKALYEISEKKDAALAKKERRVVGDAVVAFNEGVDKTVAAGKSEEARKIGKVKKAYNIFTRNSAGAKAGDKRNGGSQTDSIGASKESPSATPSFSDIVVSNEEQTTDTSGATNQSGSKTAKENRFGKKEGQGRQK